VVSGSPLQDKECETRGRVALKFGVRVPMFHTTSPFARSINCGESAERIDHVDFLMSREQRGAGCLPPITPHQRTRQGDKQYTQRSSSSLLLLRPFRLLSPLLISSAATVSTLRSLPETMCSAYSASEERPRWELQEVRCCHPLRPRTLANLLRLNGNPQGPVFSRH